jgi:hypothetical protein
MDGTMFGRCVVTTLVAAGLIGCNGDGTLGPDEDMNLGRRLTSLSTVWSYLEWSPDGSRIYFVPGVFTADGARLVEIDVGTGVATTLATCVFPEPVAATSAGVAYLGGCGTIPSLHLIHQGMDTVLATGVRWVVRTFDRSKLVYGIFEEAPTGPPGYSVTVLELSTMTSQQVPVSGVPPTYPDPVLMSPSGTELLVSNGSTPLLLARLSLESGSWATVSQSWDNPLTLGWADAGVLLLHGFSGQHLAEGFTGQTVAELPDDPHVIFHQWVPGFVDPAGRNVALGSRGCTLIFEPQQTCEEARLTLWVRDLTTSEMKRVASSKAPVLDRLDRGNLFGRGAFSPDGRSIAYIIDGDVFVADTP